MPQYRFMVADVEHSKLTHMPRYVIMCVSIELYQNHKLPFLLQAAEMGRFDFDRAIARQRDGAKRNRAESAAEIMYRRFT